MIPVDISPSPTIDTAASYSSLVNDGITACQAMDTGRWLLGEYTRQLVTYYNERTIEQYADDVKIDASRLYEFALMASYYSLETRESLSELNLCYSQYREARRLKDLDKSIAFLKKAALNLWTIAQTRSALKEHFSPDALPSYSDNPAMTDLNNRPVNERPVYQWRGPASVTIDAKGIVRLQCDHAPEVEQGKRYMVSFEEY